MTPKHLSEYDELADGDMVHHTILFPDGSSSEHVETAAEHAECVERHHREAMADQDALEAAQASLPGL